MLVTRLLSSVVATLAALFMLHMGSAAGAANAGCRDAGLVATDEATRQRASQALLCVVNHVRLARRLAPVRLSKPLGVAAMRHSTDMVAHKYFAHDGIAGDRLADRARDAGYPASRTVSEALAWCMAPTPRVLAKTLLTSAAHRRIVLTRSARDVGVGLVLGAPAAGIPGASATLSLTIGG